MGKIKILPKLFQPKYPHSKVLESLHPKTKPLFLPDINFFLQ